LSAKKKTENKERTERKRKDITLNHRRFSSSDLNHRISKSGVLEPSSDVIERGSGDAIGARPPRIKR
jgi:hypothetical protein